MLKIRLSRGGRKKVPFYRLVVTDINSPRDSKFIEKLGTFNPLLADDNKERLVVNQERIEYWLSVGAQPSERVAKILIALGVKGADKHQPNFEPKAKGSNLKKKALERVKAEEEAKAKAAEEAKAAAEAAEAEKKAAAEAKKAEAEAAKAAAEAPKEEAAPAEEKKEEAKAE